MSKRVLIVLAVTFLLLVAASICVPVRSAWPQSNGQTSSRAFFTDGTAPPPTPAPPIVQYRLVWNRHAEWSPNGRFEEWPIRWPLLAGELAALVLLGGLLALALHLLDRRARSL